MSYSPGAPHGVFNGGATASRQADDTSPEHLYRLVVEHSTDVIWTARLDGFPCPRCTRNRAEAVAWARKAAEHWRFTFISPAVERLLGYHVEDAMRLGIKEILTPESYAEAVLILADELAGRVPADDGPNRRLVTLEVLTRQGVSRWCEISVTFLRDEAGRLAGAVGAARDISERRAVERALRESETMLRNLMANIPDLVVVVDQRAKILFANRSVPGATVEQLIGSTGFGFLRPDYQDVARQALREVFTKRDPVRVEVVDVFDLWWECRLVPIVDAELLLCAMIVCADITERRRAEEALRKEQEHLRHMLDALERDREAIALNLHDRIAQQLAGALMMLEWSAESAEGWREGAREAFQTGVRIVRESIEDSRRLVSGLRPTVLDEFGVLPAIEHLVQLNRRDDGPEVVFIAADDFPRLARPLENALFRIAQELLANIRRHSRARHASLELGCDGGVVRLVARDNGVGFRPEAAEAGHFGLKEIRDRVRLLGGQLKIEAAPGQGTCVRVELPLVHTVQGAIE